ncbi:uncharacterized protein LOC105843106 [Hydra vulgaris]|uniref:uncharacterized protein LOC105843106 n=1 Tax=Hydra vulgaris TaxID=6087 RepID=UPI001F5F2B2B|nr:uncharacterized protein LOC105843106 [Hydra vulgaris]
MNDIRTILLLCVVAYAQEYISIIKEFKPIQGSLLGTVNVLKKEYVVSFNVKPMTFSKNWKNVLRLTLGNEFVAYGDANPGVWFHGDGSGKLRIHAAINGDIQYHFDTTTPLDLGQWSSIKIYQNKYEGVFWFCIDVNGINIHKVKNSDARDFQSMKVYASDPWYAAQDGFISNLLIVNGNDYFFHKKDFNLIQGSLLETMNVLRKEISVSFTVKPIKFTKVWKNVLHLTLGNKFLFYGDTNPGVWFHEDGSGRLRIHAAINDDIHYHFDTSTPIDLGKWSSIKIYQNKYDSAYWFCVDVNGVNIHRVKNSDARDYKNMKVYASDPWYAAQDGFISNLLIINGNDDLNQFDSSFTDLNDITCLTSHVAVVIAAVALKQGSLFGRIFKFTNV